MNARRKRFGRLRLHLIAIAMISIALPELAWAGRSNVEQKAGRGAGCNSSCPLAPAAKDSRMVDQIVASGRAYTIIVETMSRDGSLVHRANGKLVWGRKHHIGGTDLRDLGFDRPDYEVNSALLSPEKIWTSL